MRTFAWLVVLRAVWPAGFLAAWSTADAATYYASPQGGSDGTAADRPALVARLWAVVRPGDTVLLQDGTYRGAESMIAPPKGISGTPEAPITVRAANDGRVTLDGQDEHVPVALNGNDWFVVEGVNAHSSQDTVVSLSRANHCTVRRVCGWDAADGNTNIFGAHHGEHNLFEDCAGWGISRKTFSCSQGGNFTVFRRCFALWEGCHNVGPKMAMTLFYNSHHIIAENCIATWDGRRMRESHTALGQDGKPFTGWTSRMGASAPIALTMAPRRGRACSVASPTS